MKALILRQDPQTASGISRVLMDKGFQILSVETLAVAHALIRVDTIDLLVMDERVEGQLTHAIALSGERKNPYLSAILLTDRPAEETDDLYELIPSLYALAGHDIDASIVGRLALAAVDNVDEVCARVARHAAEDAAEREKAVFADVHDVMTLNQMAAPIDDVEDADYADQIIAAPAMAEITAEVVPQPLVRIDEVIMAKVAAIFRSRGITDLTGDLVAELTEDKQPNAPAPLLLSPQVALEAAH